jgi:antitoxin HigA-1
MKFKKFSNPFHAGEILLEEFLVPLGLSQRAFAKKLAWTPRKLNEIIKSKRGITAATAIDLSEALGTSPEFWMNFQRTWDLAEEYKNRDAS